jgi:hypothetical protein
VARTEIETRPGDCATHGRVEATRELPRMGFPFIYYGLIRMLAKRRPFKCPNCGSPIASD